MKRIITLLLFSVVVLIGAAGCMEDKTQEQSNSETFKPVEPGERLQRYCQIVSLLTEDGELTPEEQQIYDDHKLQGKGQEKLSADALETLTKATKEKMLDISYPKPVKKFMELNKNVPDKVVKALSESNIRNLSVFLMKVESNYYAVRTYEYIGQNYETDIRILNRNQDYIDWSSACEECQIPFTGQGAGGLIQFSLSGDEIVYLSLDKKDGKEE